MCKYFKSESWNLGNVEIRLNGLTKKTQKLTGVTCSHSFPNISALECQKRKAPGYSVHSTTIKFFLVWFKPLVYVIELNEIEIFRAEKIFVGKIQPTNLVSLTGLASSTVDGIYATGYMCYRLSKTWQLPSVPTFFLFVIRHS